MIEFDCAWTQSGLGINIEEKSANKNKMIFLTFDSGGSSAAVVGPSWTSILVGVGVQNCFGLTRQLHRCPVHDAVEIHGGRRTVFQIIAFPGVGVAVFQDALHHHTVKTTVTHDTVVVFF